MLTEESLCLLHLCTVNKAHVTYAAVCETVNDGASKPLGKVIIDECSYVGSDGGENHNEDDAHTIVRIHCLPCCWRNHYFRGEGNERTLNSHKEGYHPIV